jgi:hypothetical protein
MIEPQSIADELGVPDLDSALRYLRDAFVTEPCEAERRNHAALIDAQLTHKGAYAVNDFLVHALKDPINRREHRELIRWCETNALVERVADELATVYAEAAERTVSSGQDRYDALLKRLMFDLVMRGANRLLVAHEAVWLSLRVRDDEPVLDVVTPSRFWAVHPIGDPTHLVGMLFDLPQPPKPTENTPRYRFVGRWQTLVLNSKCALLSSEDNPLAPSLPGVLVTLQPVAVTQRLLPERANHDLTSAETASAFQMLIANRESLSVQKQGYASGDLSAAAMGQSASSQRLVVLPEGVSVTAVDHSVDVAQYLRTAEAISDATAANHGLAPDTRKLTSAASGYELWLRAQPLVKRRREQMDVLRDAEQRIAAHMAQVIDVVGLDEYKFSPDGFAIQFGEVSMPQSEAEELANFETRRRLLLDNTISELARRGQLTDEQAAEDLATNAQRETARVGLLQDLSAMNANSATTVGDNTNSGTVAPATSDQKATVQ